MRLSENTPSSGTPTELPARLVEEEPEQTPAEEQPSTPPDIAPETEIPEKDQYDKWIAVLLCLFLGCVGGHKFYEGKIPIALLYVLTCGLFGIGVLVDLIVLLGKPNPYTLKK